MSGKHLKNSKNVKNALKGLFEINFDSYIIKSNIALRGNEMQLNLERKVKIIP